MQLAFGFVLIALGVFAVTRRVDVRLVLLATALALASLAGQPMLVVRMFLETFANERFVVPICTAMGFAYVLKETGCDQHLVQLLVKPLRRVRPLLLPGSVCVGFLVNIPIVSQTSTAVTLGAVLVPILVAARVPAVTLGAALLLGSSIGGELLNPGAPELRTVVEESSRAAKALGVAAPGLTEILVGRLLPLNLLGLLVATGLFWALSARQPVEHTEGDQAEPEELPNDFRVNLFKAAIPVLPLLLLFLTAAPLRLIAVPTNWLLDISPGAELTPGQRGLFDCRLIGAAMLVGAVVAAFTSRGEGLRVAGTFFEGAGYGFTHIISLIVAANCFGVAVREIGVASLLGGAIEAYPVLLMPLAGTLPLAFGLLCGSGMASTQSLFAFFARPALELGIDPFLVGSVVSLGSAAGRTMSPFAAVTLMSARLTRTDALQLAWRVAPPLLAAVTVEVIAAMVLASLEAVE